VEHDARKMKTLRSIAARFWAIFRKQKLDDDMDAEMRSHIEMQTQEYIEAGMKPEEAGHAALRKSKGINRSTSLKAQSYSKSLIHCRHVREPDEDDIAASKLRHRLPSRERSNLLPKQQAFRAIPRLARESEMECPSPSFQTAGRLLGPDLLADPPLAHLGEPHRI
jgi:hypothetical protein